MIIDTGIELIMALIDGIVEALPTLIEKAPEIIIKLVTALIRNFPKIIEAGIQILEKLIEGVISGIGKLGDMAWDLITAIVDGLIDGISSIADVGKELVEGLWQGIKDTWKWLQDKCKELGDNLVDGFKGIFGIHSPSKVFENEIGKFLALGLGKGFEENLAKVYKQMKTAVDFETQKLSTNISTNANVGRILNANISLDQGDIIMDSEKVGQVITPVVTRTLRGAGAY